MSSFFQIVSSLCIFLPPLYRSPPSWVWTAGEGQWMSRGVWDRDYTPNITTSGLARSSRRIRHMDPVNYSEAEEDDSYSDSSELTLLGNESGFGSNIKVEFEVERERVDSYIGH